MFRGVLFMESSFLNTLICHFKTMGINLSVKDIEMMLLSKQHGDFFNLDDDDKDFGRDFEFKWDFDNYHVELEGNVSEDWYEKNTREIIYTSLVFYKNGQRVRTFDINYETKYWGLAGHL